MIVTPRDGTVRLVLQTDHAAIAGELARRWGEFFTPFAPVVLAAALHDEGWRLWEDTPDLAPDTRRPRGFTEMDPAEHTAFYAAGIDRTVSLDPYAGLLCSLHASGLYNGRFGRQQRVLREPEDQAVAGVFLDHEAQRRERIGIALDDAVWRNYRLLQVWDTLSLAICGREVHSLPDGTRVTRAGDHLTLAPWPFHDPQLVLAVPCRQLPDRAWPEAAIFREALRAAPAAAYAVVLRPA